MTQPVDRDELVVPFGEALAVPVSERRLDMAGTIQGTVNPIRDQGRGHRQR